MRSHRRNAQARTRVEADRIGQRHGLVRRNRRVLRGGAERAAQVGLVDPDALADARRIDAVAHGVDDSRAVLVRDHDGKRHLLDAQSAAALGVRRIDRRDVDAHAHLAGAGRGERPLADAKHLPGGPLAFVECSFHVERASMRG